MAAVRSGDGARAPAEALRQALSRGASSIEVEGRMGLCGDGVGGGDELAAVDLDPRRVPLGFLELDGDGYVRHFDPAPGSGAARPVGLHFFREIAPWPQVAEVFPRFVTGVRSRELDVRVRCD